MADNIKQFNVFALRALAILYRHFPTVATLDHKSLGAPEDNGAKHGAITWLYKNGYVAGDLMESSPLGGNQTAAVTNAQLAPSTLRFLKSLGPGGKTWGEFALSVVTKSEQEQVGYAEVLVNGLLGVH